MLGGGDQSMSEAAKAVLRFTRREIGKALAAALGLGLLPPAADAFRPHFFPGGAVGSSPGTIATLMLVNTSGTMQPAGQPTQTFGWLFNDGDVPVGSVPVFKAGGVTQSFSAGPLNPGANPGTYWPSGCLKHATFMLLPTFSVTGSGSQAVVISSAPGSWPGASGRTLSADVYPQLMVAGAVPYTGQTRTAAVYGACAGDGNNLRASKWLDGAAGTAWRITTNMTTTIGNTSAADGQLVVDHYVMALNNASGGQGGFRYLPILRQPYYNSTSAHALTGVFFNPPNTGSPTAGVWWQYGSGPTATAMTWPYSASAFTATSGVLTTNSANTWWNGTGGNGGTLPIAVTGGSLPSGLANNQLLYATNLQGTTSFTPCAQSNGGSTITITGSGSGTATPVVCLIPFTRIAMATPAAKMNFFQGTGSISAETTLRSGIDRAYWSSSAYLPYAYPTYTGATQGGPITDISWSYNWDPYSIFNQDPDQEEGSGGDAPAIGIFPNIAAIDFYNQSALDETWVRGYAFGYCLQNYDFKDVTTLNAPNFDNPANTYTGRPSGITPNFLYWSGGFAAGFTPPSSTFSQPMVWEESGGAHQPNYATWAYLRFGELQFLDFMRDNMDQSGVQANFDSFGFPTTAYGAPYDAYFITNFFSLNPGEYRQMAWTQRTIEAVASFYPGNPNIPTALDFDGTQTYLYAQTVANANCAFPVDVFNYTGTYNGNSAVQTYIQNRGMWQPANSDFFNGMGNTFTTVAQDTPWEFGMMMQVMAWGALRGSTKAQEFLTLAAQRWNYILNTYGGWHLYAYFCSCGIPSFLGANSGLASQLMDNDNQFGVSFDPALSVGWQTSSPHFFVGAPNQDNAGGWTPQDGDVFQINQAPSPPIGAPSIITGLLNVYYVMNWSPPPAGPANLGEFDLASTYPGGTPIVPTDSNVGTGPNRLSFYTWSKSNLPTGTAGFFDYVFQMRAQCVYAKKALGGTAFDNIIADANYRLANSFGGPYTLYQPSGAAGEPVDARYAVA
jgi:hypothetical protein